MLLVDNAALVLTADPAREGVGLVPRGAVGIEHGLVTYVGPAAGAPPHRERIDAGGGLVTPGLVDAHAHPIFGGDRAGEFAARAAGASYLEIALAGGGIQSTVTATRNATDEDLLACTRGRLARALAWGTTTMEAKTGYALAVEGELRLLRLLRQISDDQPVTLVPTLLGAHAVPGERARVREAYVEECAGAMLEGARGLAHAVDVYCDEGAFTLDETRRVLTAAKHHGFAVRAHAGQFKGLGAAGLVAALGGLSADHLEHVEDDEARAMAAAGTVATLLAGACVQLRLPAPPVARLRKAGCAIALGTDMNPGSSNTASLPLQMWLATTHLGLTVDEAWLGVTRHAARAAGRPEAGVLAPGRPADLLVWNTDDHRVIPYVYGENLVSRVLVAGEDVTPPRR